MNYVPLIDTQQLILYLRNLPVSVTITPSRTTEPATYYHWECLLESGRAEDLQTAIHDALYSMQVQLLSASNNN